MNPLSEEASPRRRVKWEPAALMALVLFLGFWLAAGPDLWRTLPLREGAVTSELRIADSRGVLERSIGADGERTFRVLTRDGFASADMNEDDLIARFGPAVHAQAMAERPNLVFRFFKITGWASMVWIGIGFLGQAAFSSRFLIQWIASEKARRTTVPDAFWWMSLIGGVALFAYFVWRQDAVGVLGQSSGLVVYSRNLRLIYKERRRARERLALAPTSH